MGCPVASVLLVGCGVVLAAAVLVRDLMLSVQAVRSVMLSMFGAGAATRVATVVGRRDSVVAISMVGARVLATVTAGGLIEAAGVVVGAGAGALALISA